MYSHKSCPCSWTYFSFITVTATLLQVSSCETTSVLPTNVTVPAVFFFGDSTVDPGNNDHLHTLVKSNFLPYGRDFIGKERTGRFSNGKVPSDFVAEILGVKELVPPYRSQDLQLQDLLTGVSFASGGSGYDPITSKLVSVLSLSDQLEMLVDYTRKIKAEVGEKRTKTILSNSIFMVSTGTDDIANTYFMTPLRRFNYTIGEYTDLMVNHASSFLKELYGLGARRIGVMSVPTIGCVPFQRTVGGGFLRGCAKSTNEAAVLFNSKLYAQMKSLNKEIPDARLVYLDTYNPVHHLLTNPVHYGFEVVDKGCCGTGNVEGSYLCSRYIANSCPNASKYLFWDSYHPSEIAYKILSHMVIDKKNMDKFF